MSPNIHLHLHLLHPSPPSSIAPQWTEEGQEEEGQEEEEEEEEEGLRLQLLEHPGLIDQLPMADLYLSTEYQALALALFLDQGGQG